MKVFYFLLKKGLCLSLPVAFSLAAGLVVPTSVRAQGGNQSDVTGPAPVQPPGGTTGGGNQSDVTGPKPPTTTTTTTKVVTSTGIKITVIRISVASTIFTETSSTTQTTTGSNSQTPTSSGTQSPTIEPVSQTIEPAPQVPAETSTETTAPPEIETTTPTPEPVAETVSEPVAQQNPGGQSQTPSGNAPGSNAAPTPTVTEALDIAVGPQRFLFVVPSSSDDVSGNAFDTLAGLTNLGSLSNMRILGAWSWGSQGALLVRINGRRILLALSGISPGASQNTPVLPNGMQAGAFSFVGVVTGAWVDPPTTEGYRYTMTSDSLFTKIEDFPTGFPNNFTVSVGDRVLGEFGPGDTVDFSDFPGGGVEEFTITGITPFLDPDNPMAFPVKLAFNTETADFMMKPLENPEAVAYYEQNPPADEPFAVNVMSRDGTVEVVPSTTAKVLRENADRLASSIADASKREQFLTTVAAVEKDIQNLGTHFQTLLPQGGGLNVSGLNPSMASVEDLRGSLPMLLQQLSALSEKTSGTEAMAIAKLVEEVEGMTTLLEAMTPMLSQMSDSIAVAR